MTGSDKRQVAVIITDEHLQKMVENHLLASDEVRDQRKIALIVQRLLDGALGLPETPWHDWEGWVKALE